VTRLVNRYIGVQGGYLGDFSYRTHADFYPEYCDLDINPYDFEGTTRERFIEILSSRSPADQATILRGVLERFPVGQRDAPTTRSEEYRNELLRTIAHLESAPPVRGTVVQITTVTVRQALDDAEVLLRSHGPVSALDRTHTALHGYLKYVAATAGIPFRPDASTTGLLKLLRSSHPKFAALGPRSQDIEKVLNSCGAILDALLPLRNQASLAHPNEDLLSEAEAMLVLNVARSLLTYLDSRLI
jgi:hypothetical protein